jgi:translation initiation factor IF-3
LRVIGSNGAQIGVLSRYDAIQLAQNEGLDLVEVSPNVSPPVCRIIDYGKFLFEQNKKAKDQNRKQKQIQVKEIQLRPVTDIGDYQIKMRNAIAFLTEGNKVRVVLKYRGREMQHQDIGREMMKRVVTDLSEHGTPEKNSLMEGKQLITLFVPKKEK